MTKMNGGFPYIYRWYSCRFRWKTSRFFWILTVIKQCFWYGVVYHFTKWDLHVPPLSERNMWNGSALCQTLWTTLKISLCFEFNQFMSSATSSSCNICDMKFGRAEVLFDFPSSESRSLGHFDPWFSSFSVWLCWSWLRNSLINLNPHMAQISICSCLQHTGLHLFAVCFDALAENLIKFFFISERTK